MNNETQQNVEFYASSQDPYATIQYAVVTSLLETPIFSDWQIQTLPNNGFIYIQCTSEDSINTLYYKIPFMLTDIIS